MRRDSSRRPGYSRRRFLATVGIAAVAGCTSGNGSDGSDGSDGTTTAPPVDSGYGLATPGATVDWQMPTDAPRADVTVETLAEGLEIPWDIAFAGEGELYVTERTGQIL
ncbi:MAG: glucose/arabinose dehydrogenase, partial [Haloarculaceae archaeon]